MLTCWTARSVATHHDDAFERSGACDTANNQLLDLLISHFIPACNLDDVHGQHTAFGHL
jgi:hypothetical protein